MYRLGTVPKHSPLDGTSLSILLRVVFGKLYLDSEAV